MGQVSVASVVERIRTPEFAGAARALLLAAVGIALTWIFVWSVPDVRGSLAPTYPYTQDLPAEAMDPTRG